MGSLLADVTALVPSFNDPGMLRTHLERSGEWLGQCGEVLVVDSSETRDCLDLAQEFLGKHPKARFLTYPPGLYASWNYGFREAGRPYTYISTLCDFIDQTGLEHLVNVADEFEADLVLSPPRFEGDEKARWPLHHFLEELGATKPFKIPPFLWLATCLTGNTKTLMGSSASNLYSTETLRRRPFPEDLGALGDSGWAARHGGTCSVAITPQECAAFCLHTNRQYQSADWDRLTLRLAEYLREGIGELGTEEGPIPADLVRAALATGCSELTTLRRNFYELTGIYELNEELRHYNAESEKDRALKQELINDLHRVIAEQKTVIEGLSQDVRAARAELQRLDSFGELVRHVASLVRRKVKRSS